MDHPIALLTFAAERYILSELSPAEQEAYEAHFLCCPACAEEVLAAAALRDSIRSLASP